jgi:hypothetical protein
LPKPPVQVVAAVALGAVCYVVAILTTLSPLTYQLYPKAPFVILLFTSIGAVVVLLLGYLSIIVFGGILSLRFADFIARLSNSKHVVEFADPNSKSLSLRILKIKLLHIPLIVFGLSIALSWDIYNGDGARASFLQPVFHALDVFSKPLSLDRVLYAVDVTPTLVAVVALGGLVPSIVLPYFEKFKITGVNSSPFHIGILESWAGALAGLGVALALVGFVYRVLWVSRTPVYYHFALLAMLGMSLHYAVGVYLGVDKSERLVMERLTNKKGQGRIVVGSVTVNPKD